MLPIRACVQARVVIFFFCETVCSLGMAIFIHTVFLCVCARGIRYIHQEVCIHSRQITLTPTQNASYLSLLTDNLSFFGVLFSSGI